MDQEEATGAGPRRRSVWERQERPARGSTASLSRDQIVQAAIGLIDAEGLDALTMRRLATRMGVAVMSLYWYVGSKSDLRELVTDAIFGELDLPPEPSGDWRADLRLLAISTRAVFFRHPWLATMMGGEELHAGPNFLRHVEHTFASLSRLGVPIQLMVATASAVDSYVFGSIMQRTAGPRFPSDPDERQAIKDTYLRAIGMGTYPTLSGMDAAFSVWAEVDDDDDAQFLYGLDALLDGLHRRLTDTGATTARETDDSDSN